MGGVASRGLQCPEDFVDLDLGPRLPLDLPENGVFSFEIAAHPGHYLRHRAFEVWVDPTNAAITEQDALDASFVVVPGLAGYAHSLRSANMPLHFVRHKDSRLCISRYDGSALLRADATFELRTEEEGASTLNCGPSATGSKSATGTVCVFFMSTNFKGKYLYVNNDHRVMLEKFDPLKKAAYQFNVHEGFALKFTDGLERPLVWDDRSGHVHPPREKCSAVPDGATTTRMTEEEAPSSRPRQASQEPHLQTSVGTAASHGCAAADLSGKSADPGCSSHPSASQETKANHMSLSLADMLGLRANVPRTPTWTARPEFAESQLQKADVGLPSVSAASPSNITFEAVD